MKRSTIFSPILLLLAIGLPERHAAAAEDLREKPQLAVWTTHALVKVRPGDPPGEARSVEILAARNEFEPFQIVLRAQSGAVENVDLELTDLEGPAGARISRERITLYRQGYLTLQRPSSAEGAAGDWPDPLFPKVDAYAGERRTAFPFALQPGRNQPLWVEVHVPHDAAPGNYRGTAFILVAGTVLHRVPVSLQVWSFSLPATSSLKTTFGFSGLSAVRQHEPSWDDGQLADISSLYAKAALRHRISIHGGTMAAPPFSYDGGILKVDWTRYDREVGPFLDGTVFGPDEPLHGARATTVELRLHPGLDTDSKKVDYFREWAMHFKSRGWFERLFYYVQDEPPVSDFPKVRALAALAHRADPQLRVLTTTPLDPRLGGEIDIWAPLVNCFEKKPGYAGFCRITVSREEYDKAGGGQVWWYQSCGSHGCGDTDDGYFRGWPSYVIDAPAIAHRIMQWLTWNYRIGGELYYSMNEAYQRRVDPFTDVYMHGGNGDGTLFYPGRPGQIGGRTPIPIESVRLKLIREGLEDYEYLGMLQAMGRTDFARERVQRLAGRTYAWEGDPEIFYSVRRELGEELEQMNGGVQ